MNEKDIADARILLRNKHEIKWAIRAQEEETSVDIRIQNTVIVVRASVLKELLDKELNYVNRRLKSLGVTEIT
jgi:hypothetical protein|tara:strand:+ start:68 stop:286 length:219 start_codon:yes stop_codon:yes gene_type:complete